MWTTAAHQVTLSALTLRHAGFRDRVRAAAAAGFQQIGLSVDQYEQDRLELGDRDMQQLLDAHGVRVAEVELLDGWPAFGRGGQRTEPDRTVFHLARVFRPDRIHATCFGQFPFRTLAAGLATAAEHAAAEGAGVALEYMPYAGVPSLSAAWRLVEAAAHPAVGVLIDTWHWTRGHTTTAELAAVPADRVAAVQLCDTLREAWPDQRAEALHHRLPPGTGDAELPSLLRVLDNHGVRSPLAVEVPSDTLDGQSPFRTAEQVYRSTDRVLRQAHGDADPTAQGTPVR